MTERNISANFDYIKRIINANLVGPSNSPPYSAYLFRAYDEAGCIVSQFFMPEVAANTYGDLYAGSASFGLDLSTFWPSYDSSFGRTDLSGVYAGVGTTNWEFSAELDYDTAELIAFVVLGQTRYYKSNREVYEVGLTGNPYFTLDKRNNQYIGDKVLITRGDAVLQGAINTVSDKNILTITTSNSPASYTGYNLNSSIVEVISGAGSGQVFSVTSHTLGSSNIYVDRDCFSLSGQIVKIMPYREVSSYSGWTYSNAAGLAGNKGQGGILSRFGLTETIPNRIGSIQYASATNLGTELVEHPLSSTDGPTVQFSYLSLFSEDTSQPIYILGTNDFLGVTTGYTTRKIRVAKDTYLKDIAVGDLVIYNPISNLSNTVTGFVAKVTGSANLDLFLWPNVQPHGSSTYKVFRNNLLKLDCFPEFDKSYNCAAFPSMTGNPWDVPYGFSIQNYSSVYGSGAVFSNIKTPSAELEFSANEYEGAFGNTNYTSHFHIGPVTLSNGQILDDTYIMTGKVPPSLFFSGTVYNGNPNSPVTVMNRKGFSTQNTNVAGNFDGTYYKDGVMTFTSDVTFNASETIVCKAIVSYGSAKIERVFTIPVQPAI